MTNEETLEALAEEYLKLPDLMTGEMFAPPAYKDAFKAGFAARDREVQGLKENFEAVSGALDALKIYNKQLKEQLASQKQAAQGLVEAFNSCLAALAIHHKEKYNEPDLYNAVYKIINEALAQYRKTLEGV